jgi:hypothetical protein
LRLVHRGFNENQKNQKLDKDTDTHAKATKQISEWVKVGFQEETKSFFAHYVENDYHQVSDNYVAGTTELSGVQLDLQLFFEVGLKIANEEYFPKWYEGSEFKAARE